MPADTNYVTEPSEPQAGHGQYMNPECELQLSENYN
jgi:hypothetical protein